MTAEGRTAKLNRMRSPAPAASAARPPRDRAARSYVLHGQPVTAPPLAPGLHLVATPIGNLRDITLRALEVLAAADVIACEDTRVTRKLLDHYGIATPLTPYHEHNAAEARPKLLARLAEGAAVALVSDAGTPLVSDPGYKLVRAAREQGADVTALPGASAVLAALMVERAADRPVLLRGLPAGEGGGATHPHRRAQPHPGHARPVRDRPAARGGARRPRRRTGAARGRDLPRAHQAVRGGAARRAAGPGARVSPPAPEPRGEIVIVIAPPAAQGELDAGELDALLRQALDRVSVKEAVAEVAAVTGQSAPRHLSAGAGAQPRARPWPMSARAPDRCRRCVQLDAQTRAEIRLQIRVKLPARSARLRSEPAFRRRAAPPLF